jgi:hypothetical protein
MDGPPAPACYGNPFIPFWPRSCPPVPGVPGVVQVPPLPPSPTSPGLRPVPPAPPVPARFANRGIVSTRQRHGTGDQRMKGKHNMAAKSQGPVQVRFTAPVAGLTHNVAEIKRGDLVYVRKRPNGSNFGTPWAYTMDISAVEYVTTGFRSYGPYVTGPAVNSLRSIGDVIGGITAMRKVGSVMRSLQHQLRSP